MLSGWRSKRAVWTLPLFGCFSSVFVLLRSLPVTGGYLWKFPHIPPLENFCANWGHVLCRKQRLRTSWSTFAVLFCSPVASHPMNCLQNLPVLFQFRNLISTFSFCRAAPIRDAGWRAKLNLKKMMVWLIEKRFLEDKANLSPGCYSPEEHTGEYYYLCVGVRIDRQGIICDYLQKGGDNSLPGYRNRNNWITLHGT